MAGKPEEPDEPTDGERPADAPRPADPGGAASASRAAGIHRDHALRDALLAYAAVAVLVAIFVRAVNITLPAVGHVGSAIVAVLFLYVPVYFAWRRKEDLDDYGFHVAPVGTGLAYTFAGMILCYPVFVVIFVGFYEIVCSSELLASLAPAGMCARYGGLAGIEAPTLDLKLLEFAAIQFVVVALPEELFFRGFLLGLLEKWFPPKRRFLGGGIGKALVITSLMFALIHLPKDGDPRALITFIPGLFFGWLRSSTGSILGPTIAHGCANILIRVLEQSVL